MLDREEKISKVRGATRQGRCDRNEMRDRDGPLDRRAAGVPHTLSKTLSKPWIPGRREVRGTALDEGSGGDGDGGDGDDGNSPHPIMCGACPLIDCLPYLPSPAEDGAAIAAYTHDLTQSKHTWSHTTKKAPSLPPRRLQWAITHDQGSWEKPPFDPCFFFPLSLFAFPFRFPFLSWFPVAAGIR